MSSSSSEDTRTRIVRSLFSRKAEDGTLEETLVTYLRVKEDDGHGAVKTRYLFLAGGWNGPLGADASDASRRVHAAQGQEQLERDVLARQDVAPKRHARTRADRRE